MECDKDFNNTISQAFLEVERHVSLPKNSLFHGIWLPKISREVRLKKMEVRLDQNVLARVSEKPIRHSKELVIRKRVTEQEETISLLMNSLQLLLEQ